MWLNNLLHDFYFVVLIQFRDLCYIILVVLCDVLLKWVVVINVKHCGLLCLEFHNIMQPIFKFSFFDRCWYVFAVDILWYCQYWYHFFCSVNHVQFLSLALTKLVILGFCFPDPTCLVQSVCSLDKKCHCLFRRCLIALVARNWLAWYWDSTLK